MTFTIAITLHADETGVDGIKDRQKSIRFDGED